MGKHFTTRELLGGSAGHCPGGRALREGDSSAGVPLPDTPEQVKYSPLVSEFRLPIRHR